jgi:hypothetical protein
LNFQCAQHSGGVAMVTVIRARGWLGDLAGPRVVVDARTLDEALGLWIDKMGSDKRGSAQQMIEGGSVLIEVFEGIGVREIILVPPFGYHDQPGGQSLSA